MARAAALLAVVLLTGCGTGGLVDEETTGNGKELFQQKCGGCHTLADAGTAGSNAPTKAPNLDDAFAVPIAEGFDESTIREVVLGQMRYPTPPMPNPTDPDMFPPDEYTDEERRQAMAAIASYVASVAARPREPTQAASDPKSIFTASCASCHTLAAANATGTRAPNLDGSKLALAAIERQIRRGGGGMPPFEDTLTDAQITALAKFVFENRRR